LKPLRIFRHVVCEGPGYLAELLEREAQPWELVCLDAGTSVPGDLDRVSGLVFMGGNMSVNDRLEWIDQELDLIRRAHALGVPMLGVCFGGQLISKALGGSVEPAPQGMEVGWHPLKRIEQSRDEGWLEGLPDSIPTFHWHGETFTPPPGSTLLLENHCFRNQAFCLGDTLGMQFHLEMTEPMVLGWIRAFGRRLDPSSRCTQTVQELTAHLPYRIRKLHRVADVIFGHWLVRVRRRARLAADGR
jgi:GMP synthase-like glutamine amidotransferase